MFGSSLDRRTRIKRLHIARVQRNDLGSALLAIDADAAAGEHGTQLQTNGKKSPANRRHAKLHEGDLACGGLINIYKRYWTPLQLECGLKEDAGGPLYGFHILRYAAASLFIRYFGWTSKRLQTVMDHSSINTTFDLYRHALEDLEADRADMAKIEAAIRAA